MTRIATLLLGASLCALSTVATAADPARTACAASFEQFKAAMLEATNRTRAGARRCGGARYPQAAPLKWNDALGKAARRHSRDMADNNFFSHTGSDGLQVWHRADALGYRYVNIAENIAAGYTTVAAVQSGWVGSAGHCRNIMNGAYREMGAACVSRANTDYRRYWTVVFGKRR